ncbi:MAG TPA: sigma-70 family RNA polymerase sigma factor [Polyangiaceae bacterium]|jgi:RNA polymerase sigma-70 factor (ECF subfamily)|nr:sigma-70 family RNA polymerase sigma factor [Polyangiaceae bacterium]
MANLMVDEQFLAAVGAEERASYEKRWRAIVKDHVDFTWRALRRLGVLEADLADAAQQVFLVLARKLTLVHAGSERGFLFQTAFRVASDSRRTRTRRREVPDDLLASHPDERPGPDEDLEARLRRVQLDRILDMMPMDLRAVFVLSELEELTMAQIAELMSTPPGTVASRLRRARAAFSEHVAQLHEQERQGGG